MKLQLSFLEEKVELLYQQSCDSDEVLKLKLQLFFPEEKDELLYNHICHSSARYRGLGIICDTATVSFQHSCAKDIAEEAALRLQSWWRGQRSRNRATTSSTLQSSTPLCSTTYESAFEYMLDYCDKRTTSAPL